MLNALAMAANLADPPTGAAGVVLASTPNGSDTSTFPAFNSLGNAVASCVADSRNCTVLFNVARSPSGAANPRAHSPGTGNALPLVAARLDR